MLRPRRKIILRDSAIILILVLSTLVLYAVTAFLFGSFSQKRAELGKEFGESGKQALARGDGVQAIHDLRISLSYSPDDAYNRLLLAEALTQEKHFEEARSYFLSLLDVQPADGFINLQLARLARQKHDPQQAIQYYRAAAVGNWNNAPLDERFQVQLELANYLLAQHYSPAAKAELLIAAADAPATTDAYVELGDSFLEANDPTDAVAQYERAIKLDPKDVSAALKAGRILYQNAQYGAAYQLLSEARRTSDLKKLSSTEATELLTLIENSLRIQELAVGQSLPAREREEHLLTDLTVAKQRFTVCKTKLGDTLPPAMQSLDAEWQAADPVLHHEASLNDETQDGNMTKLVFDTEDVTAKLCGPPVGDDALLLVLANNASAAH
ncbi:MAG TPA: tetratricopeptide repeat protein [Candidatus Aquilonibacter sp.]|nr:tetratricopeptide repeat protein [Candidatus Aquilonibacter sp.]